MDSEPTAIPISRQNHLCLRMRRAQDFPAEFATIPVLNFLKHLGKLGEGAMMSTRTASDVHKSRVFFERRELNLVLSLYGKMVAAGEWRDYAMDALEDRAVFSIYRRTSEAPLYQIEKRPALARRQGAFAVLNAAGMILKRGHDLAPVLSFLEPKRLFAVE
jgi:hypothetical protein